MGLLGNFGAPHRRFRFHLVASMAVGRNGAKFLDLTGFECSPPILVIVACIDGVRLTGSRQRTKQVQPASVVAAERLASSPFERDAGRACLTDTTRANELPRRP